MAEWVSISGNRIPPEKNDDALSALRDLWRLCVNLEGVTASEWFAALERAENLIASLEEEG